MQTEETDLPYLNSGMPGRMRIPWWKPPAWLPGWWREVRELSGGILKFWRAHPRVTAGGMLVALGLVAWLVWPNDGRWLREMDAGRRLPGDRPWYELSRLLGKYGDFSYWNLALFFGLLLFSRVRRCGVLRRLATASLLGAVFSGLTVNVLRFSLGRPRPHAQMVDGFYGPCFNGRFHAFPSGHTATASGAAVPLLVACPVVGVPAALVAGSVAWARMRANMHHPSDIAASVIIAGVFGIPLGLGVRRWGKTRPQGVPIGG